MRLWEKESDCDNAHYNRLFDETLDHSTDLWLVSQMRNVISIKDNNYSNMCQETGDEMFQVKRWREAMELYNKSLRFAVVGSENVSVAYANRSNCFFYLGRYEECLWDIEQAKKANCPQTLMPKLIERKANCIKFMKKSVQVKTKVESTKMTLAGNKKYQCLADVLEVKNNDEFGTHIVTKSDIKVGEIVLMEDAFVYGITRFSQISCDTCLKLSVNFIPCPNCPYVMFCNNRCLQLNQNHKLGCGALYNNFPKIKDIVESILIAVNTFTTADELMQFVEKSLRTRDFASLQDVSNEHFKYGLFLKLYTLQNTWDPVWAARIFKIILTVPNIADRFDTVQKQRFLVHLMWQHFYIIKTNAFSTGPPEANAVEAVYSFMSLFNHACYNNVVYKPLGTRICCYAVRPIQKGEQLCIRYETTLPLQYMGKYLLDTFHFQCKCTLCQPCHKKTDLAKMQKDFNYQVCINVFDENDYLDCTKRSFLQAKARTFLTKYGSLPWCPEIQNVMSVFKKSTHQTIV